MSKFFKKLALMVSVESELRFWLGQTVSDLAEWASLILLLSFQSSFGTLKQL
jgi:hypothetical protein